MIIASIILFALGASGGAFMLFNYVMKGHHVPKGIALAHGLIVASGLVLLICHNLIVKENVNWISVGLFTAAAIMGAYVFIQDISHNKVPLNLLLVHIFLAVSGFSFLIYNNLI